MREFYTEPKQRPIAEIRYELPRGDYFDNYSYMDDTLNPVITVTYEDGTRSVFDTNLIYKRGYNAGVQDTNNSIKRKLGLN
jgi:hypothetical protein